MTSLGRGSTSRTRRRADTSDSGSSFVEVVVAVVLVGTTLVSLLTTVMATVTSSSQSRSLSQVNTVLQNAADRVNRAPKRCDYAIYVSAAAQSQGWEPSTAVSTYEHYVPGPTLATPGTWAPGACPVEGAVELLVQRVTITVTSPDGSVTRTIQVGKSDV
jgi:type II secretory pathway pseudopilin PulG